jgi:hypothetical protein
MKTITINAYEYSELTPEAKERAREWYIETIDGSPWQDEIMDSLKALFNNIDGVRLVNWSIGAYSYSFLTVTMEEDTGNLAGKRARAWLENHFLANLRIPYTGKRRWEVAQYGASYRPGMVPPCPLTGYCADDNFIDALRAGIRSGNTVREALQKLASTAQKLMEQDDEFSRSIDAVEESIIANEYEFTEDGKRCHCL